MYQNQIEKTKSKQAFAARLQDCLKKSGRSTSPTQLAAEFNAHFKGTAVHLHSCRKWLHGESIPTQEKLVVLAKMLGVTPDWLRYGQETKLLQTQVSDAFNRRELALVADYQQLNPRDQDIVQKLVGVMLRLK